jgi:predicted ester cyclase
MPSADVGEEEPEMPTNSLSVEKTKQTMHAYLKALPDRTDFSSFFTADVRWVTMESGEEIRGRNAVGEFIGSMHTLVHDAHPVLNKLVIGEGTAAREFDFVGTNTGEFEGVAATGKKLRVPYVVFYGVDEGGITELRADLPVRKILAVLRPL